MIKRFRWIFLAVLAGGVILCFALLKNGPQDTPAARQPDEKQRRESSRHQSGEIGKSLPTPLEKKIEEQEQLVEQKRKVVAALATANEPMVSPMSPPPATPRHEDSPEEQSKKTQKAQDLADARKEFFSNVRLLQDLKNQLAEEQKNAESGETK